MYPVINQTIELFLKPDEPASQYASRVADITDETIAVELPFKKAGSLLSLPVGTLLHIRYTDDMNAQCEFETRVVSTRKDNVQLALIEKPPLERITRTQRRNYLRVPAELEVAVQTPSEKFVARTQDVSGGGVSFHCEEKYKLHMDDRCQCWILIHFHNGSIEHVPFTGSFVRIRKKLNTSYQWVSLKIDQITESDQQKIIRYCFERQIQLNKKQV